MSRKSFKQRNWPREPLTRIIMKITKLHINQKNKEAKKNVTIVKANKKNSEYMFFYIAK